MPTKSFDLNKFQLYFSIESIYPFEKVNIKKFVNYE